MVTQGQEEEFKSWVEKTRNEEWEPVKLVEIIGSLQFLYTEVKEGRQTPEELEEECEGLFQGFMEVLLTNLGEPELNWGRIHSDLIDFQELNLPLSSAKRERGI
tara:strand:+ start:706 stop:1017 length:312 start_codon:yes stop_codon:yes gene_type:complete